MCTNTCRHRMNKKRPSTSSHHDMMVMANSTCKTRFYRRRIMDSSKKRRLANSTCSSSNSTLDEERRVQFCSHVTRHLVEPFATPYNRRHLWYSKEELQRQHAMELRRNLLCPSLVDPPTTTTCTDSSDDLTLTWRGLEEYQPQNNNTPGKSTTTTLWYSKQANGRSHARVIVEEYVQQRATSPDGSWDAAFLCFLSRALSKNDRAVARQRALQDQKAVHGGDSSMGDGKIERRTSRRLSSNNSIMDNRRRMNCYSLSKVFQYTTSTNYGGSSVVNYMLWVVRAVMFCIFCGLFIPE